jgi:CitMHS family citrate-Mg2+:H+ or citrate-Ca2+:H+ symporter
MLTWLGLLTIASVLGLILFRVTSPLVALTLVPVAAAVAGGFAGSVGTFAIEGMTSVAPVAALLAFAVIYFGVMHDTGLFEPVIRFVVRHVGRDPVRIALGTAAIAMISHLDGAGASTFMITVPAMLPIYRRVGMNPVVLTAATALAAGTMNMLPWGGPLIRASASLQVAPSSLFVPLLPAMAAGLVTVFLCAFVLGRIERRSIAAERLPESMVAGESGAMGTTVARGPRWLFNVALTAVALIALFANLVPPAVVFLVASALAVLVNYPDVGAQRDRVVAHGGTAMMMISTVLAAGVFTGVLTSSGMLASMAQDLVRVLPPPLLAHLPVALGILSMPLSLVFDPDSFYFGVLPVLAHASQAAGGEAVEVGRAAVLGQMTTGFPVSPLTPATFLLVGLAGVDLAEHQRTTIPYAFAVTVVMTVVAVLTGAIGV